MVNGAIVERREDGQVMQAVQLAERPIADRGRVLDPAPLPVPAEAEPTPRRPAASPDSDVLMAGFAVGALLAAALFLVAVPASGAWPWLAAGVPAAAAAATVTILRRLRAARRALAAASQDTRCTAEALAERSEMLRQLADVLPHGLVLVDEGGHCRFANAGFAGERGHDPGEMVGRGLDEILPSERAAHDLALARAALASGQVRRERFETSEGGIWRILETEHVPLSAGSVLPPGVVMLERDVTAEVAELERRRFAVEDWTETLLGAVDQRDPYAAHHAARVSELAENVAAEFGLDEDAQRTVRIAGALLTVGKVLVPEVMLSHDSGLSAAERRQARASLQATVDLLDGLPFDGPVVETIGQLQERMDGQGKPRGLRGRDLLMTARVLKVANSFVGMVSRRPGNPGLTVDEALAELMRHSGGAYDSSVVAALVGHLDGKGGRAAWQPATASANRRPPQG